MRHTGKTYRLDRHIFPGADFEAMFYPLYCTNLTPKLVPEESSQYAESNELKFINFKQTFIITKFANYKSYKICYVVKS